MMALEENQTALEEKQPLVPLLVQRKSASCHHFMIQFLPPFFLFASVFSFWFYRDPETAACRPLFPSAIFFVLFLVLTLCLCSHIPHTPKLTLESIALQNITTSKGRRHITGDWNLTFSIENPNTFRLSYVFNKVGMSDSGARYGPGSLRPIVVPFDFSQEGKNKTSFTMQLGGITVPLKNRLVGNNIFSSGANMEFSEVCLDLCIGAKMEAETDLPMCARCWSQNIYVFCESLKVGFSPGSDGAPRMYYGWPRDNCYSSYSDKREDSRSKSR